MGLPRPSTYLQPRSKGTRPRVLQWMVLEVTPSNSWVWRPIPFASWQCSWPFSACMGAWPRRTRPVLHDASCMDAPRPFARRLSSRPRLREAWLHRWHQCRRMGFCDRQQTSTGATRLSARRAWASTGTCWGSNCRWRRAKQCRAFTLTMPLRSPVPGSSQPATCHRKTSKVGALARLRARALVLATAATRQKACFSCRAACSPAACGRIAHRPLPWQ
mmetsp:Transcript_70183/g.102851  ORF Transcript_70183/g.102851 Transcript_70183/m.102851 type:complete len:218 (+) Transcript_70183:1581-2234(+)